MSAKRLNKRQLREQQELEQLAQAQAQGHADLDDAVQEPQPIKAAAAAPKKKPQQASIFAALGDQDQDDDGDYNEDENDQDDNDITTATAVKTNSAKKKNKKKKKKKQANHDAQDADDDHQGTGAANSTTKASKKQAKQGSNAQQRPQGNVDDMSMDELNALLASQAAINSSPSASSPQGKQTKASGAASLNAGTVSSFRTHLSLDPRNLDPSVELKRQFGSAAIKAYQSELSSGGSSGAGGGARARAQAMNPNLKLRTLLCNPKEYWPPIGRTFTGMSMDVAETESGRLCSWVHSRMYKQVQMQFLQAVRSYDPNALMALLRVYPWHIDTLLQLSDYSRHQGDLGQAADFNDRAMFAFERTAAPYFVSCLSSSTSGPPMVDFARIENRAFYLAVHRNIGFLGRRGTWRTALEWAKVLLGLGRDGEDHHAALLWIDFLAIKSKQHRWLLDLLTRLDEQRGRRRGGVQEINQVAVPAVSPIDSTDKAAAGEADGYEGTLDWCVGLAYARALAHRANGDEVASKAALRLAIARHPCAAALLCAKAGVELPPNMAAHPLFAGESRYSANRDTLSELLSHIYAHRSESLWKEEGNGQWLRSTAMEMFDVLCSDAGKPAIADEATRQGIYRHVLVSDLPDAVRQQLIGFLPPEVTRNSEMMDAFDPVPPAVATRYDDDYFEVVGQTGRGGQARGQEGNGDEQGLMQAFLRAIQGVAGIRGWPEAMEQMDDETREDVMAQIMEMTAAARRERGAEADEPPGGFGADGDQGDGSDWTGGGGGGGTFGAIRNALNAIWGPPRHEQAREGEAEDGAE